VREQQLYNPEVAADVQKRGAGILDRTGEAQQNKLFDQPTSKGGVGLIIDDPVPPDTPAGGQ
jgi:hypothetical protein